MYRITYHYRFPFSLEGFLDKIMNLTVYYGGPLRCTTYILHVVVVIGELLLCNTQIALQLYFLNND